MAYLPPRKDAQNGHGAIGLLCGSSYAGMNRIKFAGLIVHLSAFTAHPGRGKV